MISAEEEVMLNVCYHNVYKICFLNVCFGILGGAAARQPPPLRCDLAGLRAFYLKNSDERHCTANATNMRIAENETGASKFVNITKYC
jgi:hypothetical protein